MNCKKSLISRNCKKCVICGVRRFRNSNVHLFRFPRDPDQCRQWVKASGVEDLVHLPIEKLHELKFLCDSHFTPNSFNASRTRVHKHAVPLLNLPTPLPDELFAEFPLHIIGTSLHRFPDYKRFPERLQAWVNLVGGKLETASDFTTYKKKMVCDRHFTKADRDRNGRLNALAVPLLHLHDSKIPLHSFPSPQNDPERFRTWIFKVKGKVVGLDNLFIYKYRRVCHKHFEQRYHTWCNTLSPDSVPTLHLSDFNYCPLVNMNNSDSSINRRYKKCVLCGVRRLPNSNVFLANFPLDPVQCRLWVQAAGEEDLVHVPIEKLHQLKFLCGSHFTPNCFNAKGNRLRKFAVPSLNLPEPLNDELFKEFPLHLSEVTAILHKFPNPVKFKELFNSWLYAIGGEILKLQNAHIFKYRRVCQVHFEPKYWCRNSRLSVNALPTKHMPGFKDEKNKDAPPCKKIKRIEQPPKQLTECVEPNVPEVVTEVEENVPDTDLRCPSPHSDAPNPEPEPGPFSWQKSQPFCVEKDDILSDISQSDKEVPVVELDKEYKPKILNEATGDPSKYTITDKEGEDEKYVSEKHAEFSCDHCLGEIIGYTCVQCDNFDLCRACEAQLVHPHHYMLRVPKPRPFNEIRSVIASIRVKLKLLEEAFKQNSGDWADVVIKKEEDPLEGGDTTVTQPATEDPLEESVVPNADIDESQETINQDSKSTSKDIQKKTSNLPHSTSITESSVQKSTVVSKKRVILSGILDKDVIFVKNDVVPKANLVFTQRKDALLNTNVKFIKQDTAIPNIDLKLDKESKSSNKSVKLVKQNTSTNLIFLQQKQIIPKTDAIKFQLQNRTSNIKKTSLQDTAVKTDINLQQAISETNVLEANADTNTNEMIEEYLDEVWLDESILGEDNGDKDKTTEAEQSKPIIAEKSQRDNVKELEEEETKEKALETEENINKRTKERIKESKILNYKIKEAAASHEDVIQHSNMLPIAETDDVTVVRMNVNQSNVEKPYNYYYYKLLPKKDKHK